MSDLTETLTEPRDRLIAAIGEQTRATKDLIIRLDKLEASAHVPPCAYVKEEAQKRELADVKMESRVAAVEKSSSKFSDVFWKVVAALATAAALALWKVH